MLTKVPLSMLSGRGQPNSDVRFDGRDVVVVGETQDAADFGVDGGNYDATTGTLTLTLRNGATLTLQGFTTVNDVGVGQAGPTGPAGRDGKDGQNGRDGDQGPVGCAGPAGKRGREGPRGYMGLPGATGPAGPTGPTGPDGKDGIVQVWIQSDDPMNQSANHVVAGAIWIKP